MWGERRERVKEVGQWEKGGAGKGKGRRVKGHEHRDKHLDGKNR